MPVLTNASETQADETPRCRLCDAVLATEAMAGPKCGLPVRRRSRDPVDVRPMDVALSIVMAIIAAVLTVPITCSVTASLILSGNFRGLGDDLLLIVCWNCVIVGLPVVILIRRWIWRVRRGDFERAWMWRDYWWFQLLAFSPVIGGLFALWLFSGIMDFVLRLVG
ncbi:MAG TPA: hypothetical protein VFG20_19205 [Planctomycetaceae bacterium]|nr:hypothetical protein [Planctomycetaceae bacterium]